MAGGDTITPADILAFWREAGYDCWYKKDDAFDAEVRRRYLGLWQSASAGELSAWEERDDGALALTIFPEVFRDVGSMRMLVFAVVLLLMMLFRPHGLWPERRH